ncbi:hypothetical protein B5S30_g4822 [[Candida] boidinii]|nr:hypothetical protein B5S30_g4822 [[Candida] boidinii]
MNCIKIEIGINDKNSRLSKDNKGISSTNSNDKVSNMNDNSDDVHQHGIHSNVVHHSNSISLHHRTNSMLLSVNNNESTALPVPVSVQNSVSMTTPSNDAVVLDDDPMSGLQGLAETSSVNIDSLAVGEEVSMAVDTPQLVGNDVDIMEDEDNKKRLNNDNSVFDEDDDENSGLSNGSSTAKRDIKFIKKIYDFESISNIKIFNKFWSVVVEDKDKLTSLLTNSNFYNDLDTSGANNTNNNTNNSNNNSNNNNVHSGNSKINNNVSKIEKEKLNDFKNIFVSMILFTNETFNGSDNKSLNINNLISNLNFYNLFVVQILFKFYLERNLGNIELKDEYEKKSNFNKNIISILLTFDKRQESKLNSINDDCLIGEMFELIDDNYKIGFLHASEEIFLSSENFPKISINNNYENSVNYIKYLLFIIATCSRLCNSTYGGYGSTNDNKSKNTGGSSSANTPGSSTNTPSSGNNNMSYGISGHGSNNFSSSMDISSRADNNNNNRNKEETSSDSGYIALSDTLVFSLNLSLEKLIYYCLKLEKKRILNNSLATTKNSSLSNSNVTNSNTTASAAVITPSADAELEVSLPESTSVSGPTINATSVSSTSDPVVVSSSDKRNNNIQQLKLEQNLERAIILLVRIILIHKKFLIELIIKRSVNLQTDTFLINLVKLINCKIIQENFKLKSLLYDVLISIKTCISESINNLNKQNNASIGNTAGGNPTGGSNNNSNNNNNNNNSVSGSNQLPALASNNLSISSLSINRGTPTSSSFLSPANSPMAPPQINLTPNSRGISNSMYYSNTPNTPTHQQFSISSQQQQQQAQQHGSFQQQQHHVQQQQIQQFQQQISGIINVTPPGYGGGDDGRNSGANGIGGNVIGNGIGGNGNGKGNNRLIHLLKPLMIKYGFKNGLIINHETFNLSSKFFVYDSRNENYLLFNFQRFELIEDANPNIGINDSSISLQYFNSCIERKNPK